MTAPGRLHALVLAGGDLTPTDALRARARKARIVIAADGGLRHASPLGVLPAAIVGDFDSVTQDDLRAFPDVPRVRHPADKGELDVELAVADARARGAGAIDVMGAFGTRLDQSIATLLVCARLQAEGVRCTLYASGATAHPLAPGDTVRLSAGAGATFSVLALAGDAEVTIRGAKWSADRRRLPFGVGLGVSNRVVRDASVTCHHGLLAAIVERSA